MPGSAMGPPESESESTSSLLADLPWVPEGELPLIVFTLFLLMATLFIRSKNYSKKEK
jgi:hypothetical protein